MNSTLSIIQHHLSNIFLVSFILLLASCWEIGVRGSGDIDTETRQLSSFQSVELRGKGKLIITQGEQQEFKIVAEDNMIELMETEVDDNHLTIVFEERIRPTEDIKIYITMPEVTSLSVSGAGDIIGNSLIQGASLDLEVNGAGDINMEVDVRVLKSKISGAGDIQLDGRADKHDFRVSGAGELNAYDLVTQESKVKISGAGSCNIYVQQELSVNISGAGDVYYKGDPEIVNKKVSGAGSIKKRD